MFINTKTSLLVIVFLIFTTFSKAQTPSTCFEIESILVDACGTIEGENEMVRFVVGPTNLNVNNLNINWANGSNSYLGICKNATTASKVAALNNSIVGCGFLKEPTANILPAGSKVLLLTSTSFDVSANTFSGLNDTLFVIFQCSGNTAGHFANYNSSGLRTLSMSFSPPSGCSDVVTYDRSLLIDPLGIPMASDGARVDFTWSGNATYANNGCAAPVSVNTIDILNTNISICSGDTINLNASIIGNLSNILWTGNNGSFSSLTNSSTNYFSSLTDNANFYIYLSGTTTCGLVIKDSVLVQINNNTSSVNITSSSTELCSGDSILLTANGTGNYLWSNNSTANSIYVNAAGTYSVSSNSTCGNSIDSIIITASPTINLNLTTANTTICIGNTATLTANGAPNFTWFNGNTSSTQNVTSTGNYYVIGYNNCYRDSQSIAISVVTPPNVTISSSSTSNILCSGETIMLTINGGNNYLWNTADTSSSLLITSAGTYTVTSTSSCGNSTANVTITDSPTINLSLTTSDTLICIGNTAILNASGAPNFTWFNGNTGTTQTVNSTGNYYVIGYNDCYRDSQSVTISVLSPPSLTLSSSSTTNILCSGETITLTANGTDNYLWNTTDTTNSIAITISGTYTVSSSNFCGTVTIPITINTGILPIATISGDSIICSNNVVLTATGGDTYLWSNGNQSASTNINSAQQIELIAFNSCGSDTTYKTIYDYSLTANFTSNYTPDNNAPIEISFTNLSTNSLTYSWDFGDGSTDTLVNPSHNYTNNGEYTVVLTSYNEFCSDSYETIFVFNNANGVYIPNVFTPNNDEVNDVFSIVGENISKIECQIFNRWGEKLFTWDSIDGFWDGAYKGNKVSDGTYFYVARIVWNDFTTQTYNGHVTVLK